MPNQFDSEPLICPGRYNFPQGAIYRLKVTNIPGRPGVELYPTLEVAPAVPRTEAFLAHNAVPVQYTEEDFDQVLTGNFVTKVIYLPDPEFQELALAGVETLVSTRLEPGVDPIVEADRRGAILAVVRIGNKDVQLPSDLIQAEEGVMKAGYLQAQPAGPQAVPGSAIPVGMPIGAAGTVPTPYICGINAPQYGMPMSGTPIGLPGPPHVPLGIPAGLEKHVMVNHTRQQLPQPTHHVRIDVRQTPGFSYPKPTNHARVVERAPLGLGKLLQPFGNRREVIRQGACQCEGPCQCPTNSQPEYSEQQAAQQLYSELQPSEQQ